MKWNVEHGGDWASWIVVVESGWNRPKNLCGGGRIIGALVLVGSAARWLGGSAA